MDHSTKTVLYFTKSGNTTQQPEPGGPGTPVLSTSRLAQLVERKTLNLVVVGSSPTVGVLYFCFLQIFGIRREPVARYPAMFSLLWRSWQRVGLIILRSRVRSSPGALYFFLFCLAWDALCARRPPYVRHGFRLDGRAVQGASLRH